MNRTDACPTNLTEVEEASKRLKCGPDVFGNNQYMCLPDVNKTSLVEFCYDGIMGIQEKGNCLEVNVLDGKLHANKCNTFASGCPQDHYWNRDFFKYPACQNISLKHRCYALDPSCADLLKNYFNDDDLNNNFSNYAMFASILISTLMIVTLTCVLLFLYKRRIHVRERYRENTKVQHDAKKISLLLKPHEENTKLQHDAKKIPLLLKPHEDKLLATGNMKRVYM